MMLNNQQKCSFIALIGAPNSGKSSLVNQLVGEKISIVSPKVQTTRNTIKAILSEGETQLVFLDTPGIFIPKHTRILERMIVRSAWQAIKEADHVCLLIDAVTGFKINIEKILEDLKKHQIVPTIIINKVDIVKKQEMLKIIAKLADLGLEKIFMVSALTGDGVLDLKNYLISIANLCSWAFEADDITDAPMKFMASEITREKLFLALKEDLPYSLYVKTDSWEDLGDDRVKIHQTIFVLKESQKMIVIGKHGSMIKQIGIDSRNDIAKMTGGRVQLFLFVKVEENWINKKKSYEINS